MKWGTTVLILYLLFFFGTFASAMIGAYWFWNNRKINGSAQIMVRQAFLLAAISYMFASDLAVYFFGVVRPHLVYPIAYVALKLSSGAVLLAGVLGLVRIAIGRHK